MTASCCYETQEVRVLYACLGENSLLLGSHGSLNLASCCSILFMLPHHLHQPYVTSHAAGRSTLKDYRYHGAPPTLMSRSMICHMTCHK